MSGSLDTRALIQELKTNRRTQAALAGFALVLGWMVYTLGGGDTPAHRPAAAPAVAGSLDPRQVQSLRKLPDLAALDKAGELPPAPKLVRDLFVFDAPKPPPPQVKPPPPPPPPTPEELEQQRVAQERQAYVTGLTSGLRYLGYMAGQPSGTVGAFMRGEEPVTLVVGQTYGDGWKLTTVTDVTAQFQNAKYPDLTATLTAKDSGSAAPTSNNF